MQPDIDIALLHNLPVEVDSIARLDDAISLIGLQAMEVHIFDLELSWGSNGLLQASCRGRALPRLIFTRVIADARFQPVLRGLVDAGYVLVNDPYRVADSSNKLLGPLRVAAGGVPVVPSVLAPRGSSSRVLERLSECSITEWPLIVKPLSGMGGDGVLLARDAAELSAIVGQLAEPHLVQPYLESEDIRAFLVGGSVVAAMRRIRAANEHRANLHQGGVGEATMLSDDEAAMATRAAAICGLDVVGIDLLRTPHGSFVLELNPNPGFQIARVTDTDVCGLIAAHLASFLRRY